MRAGTRPVVALGVAAALVLAGCGTDDDEPAATGERQDEAAVDEVETAAVAGELTGPVTAGTRGFAGTPAVVDLAAAGFVEEELFVSGEAVAYEAQGGWGADGEWDVTPGEPAGYTTRALVRRPADPADFNGTVLVEWLNVSSSIDIDVVWGYVAEEVLREGYAWIGVSAQAAGIQGTGRPGQFGEGATPLRDWDPERYGQLTHPGDAWSYDIYSQVGAAIREASGSELLGGLEVDDVLAVGESQSAFRMLTYVNAVHPLAQVYDGFLIHSRNGSGAPLGDGMTGEGTPEVARVRTDDEAPVLQVMTETDLFQLGAPFPPARQPDGERVRTWELAGAAHADGAYLRSVHAQGLKQFGGDFLDLSAVFDLASNAAQPEVLRAALRHLRTWVREGTPPPAGEPLEVAGGTIVRDEHGIALGGVRTPLVDVPVATLTGEGNSLIGRTTPFDAATLARLYPSKAAYLERFSAALDEAVDAGFVLAEDAPALLAAAEARTFD